MDLLVQHTGLYMCHGVLYYHDQVGIEKKEFALEGKFPSTKHNPREMNQQRNNH